MPGISSPVKSLRLGTLLGLIKLFILPSFFIMTYINKNRLQRSGYHDKMIALFVNQHNSTVYAGGIMVQREGFARFTHGKLAIDKFGVKFKLTGCEVMSG